MHKKNKLAIKHLKEDKKTWEKISKLASKEAKSDAKLIKRLQ